MADTPCRRAPPARPSILPVRSARPGGAFAQTLLESEPNRSYEIILGHGVVRYGDLITSADDEALPWGDLEAA
jgi:hypothetical protein